MKRAMFLTLLLTSLSLPATQAAAHTVAANPEKLQDNFYTSVSDLLQKHVTNGQVNYKALQKDKAKLNRLTKQIADYNLQNATDAEKKAFYINAYNVLVLQQVMEYYPIKSVMDIPGFFEKKEFVVAGESLTLNELEKKKLVAPYKDARIHFALVCAAKSCPPLLNTAYIPEQVEKQLENQTKLALRNPVFIRVQPKQQQVQISEIFKWYQSDFLAEAPSIASYINKYRTKPLPQQYKLTYYTYNWNLNESDK